MKLENELKVDLNEDEKLIDKVKIKKTDLHTEESSSLVIKNGCL